MALQVNICAADPDLSTAWHTTHGRFNGGSSSVRFSPSSNTPTVPRQKSAGGNCIGAIAPSRKHRSSGDDLKIARVPPSVSAVRVMRVTASPTKYFARNIAASAAWGRPRRIAQPGRVIGHQPRCLEGDAHLRHAPAHVRMVGERLHIAGRDPSLEHPGDFLVGRGSHARLAKSSASRRARVWCSLASSVI